MKNFFASQVMELGLASMVLGVVGVGMIAPAQAFTIDKVVNVNGINYGVGWCVGFYSVCTDLIETSAWWNDETLANQVRDEFDRTFDEVGPTNNFYGRYFVFDAGNDLFNLVSGGMLIKRELQNQNKLDWECTPTRCGDPVWAVGYAETASPTAVPTPAVVLPGLFGLGFSAVRKKRKEKA